MSEHGESAPPSDSSRRSRADSLVVLEDAEEDPSVVQSELLTYVVYYYQRNLTEMIKNTVLAFYTAEEIVKANTVIWHAYENCLPPERRRVTTDKRSANEANLSFGSEGVWPEPRDPHAIHENASDAPRIGYVGPRTVLERDVIIIII